MAVECKTVGFWRGVMAEALGTFLYVFLVCAVTLDWSPNVYRAVLTTSDLLQVALASGLALCTLTQSFYHISGCHINPAISMAALVTCRISPIRVLLYVIVQCGGGVAGAALLYGIVPEESQGVLGSTRLNPSLTPAHGLGVEFLMTFILTFTYCATTDTRGQGQVQSNEAIPLGMTMTLLHIVGYRLTGCSCNPARSLGPAVMTTTWENHWVYWTGPVAGAVVASLLYHFVFTKSRGFKARACTLSGLNQGNVQEEEEDETVFSIHGNQKNKNSRKHAAPPVWNDANLPADGASKLAATAAVTSMHHHGEPGPLTRKYFFHMPETVATPGSVETGLHLSVAPDVGQGHTEGQGHDGTLGPCASGVVHQRAPHCNVDNESGVMHIQPTNVCRHDNIV